MLRNVAKCYIFWRVSRLGDPRPYRTMTKTVSLFCQIALAAGVGKSEHQFLDLPSRQDAVATKLLACVSAG